MSYDITREGRNPVRNYKQNETYVAQEVCNFLVVNEFS